MLHVVLDWQKIFKAILEKAFSYHFSVLVSKKIEKRPF
jgi:hypothetical protein